MKRDGIYFISLLKRAGAKKALQKNNKKLSKKGLTIGMQSDIMFKSPRNVSGEKVAKISMRKKANYTADVW